ncbi:MAG TPA: DUF4350 domain-containing protein [Lysobacter sp.]
MKLQPRHRHIALGVLAAVLLLAGAGVWWHRTYERVQESIDLPRTGEARSNPLYVLKLALLGDGVKAQARPRLQRERHPLGPRDTVLVYDDPRTLSRADAAALLDWVARGGHLLLRTPPSGPIADDAWIPVLSQLDLAMMNERSDCAGWDVPGDDKHVEFCGSRRFQPVGGASLSQRWGDAERGYVHARVPHGRGVVDVVADFAFLGNDELKDGPHVALARQLLAPNYRAGTVHLVYAAQMPSFWMTLVRESWMAWLPLLLALSAWLWRRTQRFGPQWPSAAAERRSLLEHIVASGEHIYRYGYGHVLHEAARNAFLARLRRRDPQAAALTGETQVALLAERFGMTPSDVRDALSTPIAHDHAAFRSRIATLVRMRNSL